MNNERILALKSRLQVGESESTYVLKNVLKVYPDKMKWIRFLTPREVKKPGLESQAQEQQISLKQLSVEEMLERKEKVLDKSISRSRTKIRDLVACNEWDQFWTLTFKESEYPLGDDEKRRNKLTKWIWYQTSKYGKFEYLAVPERHKRGGIHFHLLVRGYNGPIKRAVYPQGTKRAGQERSDGGRPTYNLTDWNKQGFSTAQAVGDRDRLASYVTKYITKDLDKDDQEENRRRYWHSTGLNTPVVHHNVSRVLIDLMGGDVDKGSDKYVSDHAIFEDFPLKGGKPLPKKPQKRTK